jgi:hypothetical protein
METLTLQQLFGVSVSQDETTLTILKNDLVSVGLTPSTTNTAESLLAAIILKLLRLFSDSLDDGTGDVLADENGNAFEIGDGNIYENYFCEYWRSNITTRQGFKSHNHQILVREYESA